MFVYGEDGLDEISLLGKTTIAELADGEIKRYTIAPEDFGLKSCKLEDIKTIAKYRPKALTLMGGEDGKEPVFAVGITNGTGNINSVGASFGRETNDEEKLASITLVNNCACGADVKECVAEDIGPIVMNLNKVEAAIPAVLEEIAAEKAAILANISVAQ